MKDNGSIEKRTLGNTDIEVSPIGLGVMELSGGSGLFGLIFPDLSPEQENAIIMAAVDGGINWFDTAEMYGFGRSERALARGLQAAEISDQEVVVATKWWPLPRTASNIPKTIGDRQRNLEPYTIDLYMVHQPWSFSTPEAEMDAMADLVEAGRIRSVGVSNFNAERMQRACEALQKRGLALAVNQVEYSLTNRKIESDGTLAKARELGVTIIAYTPLGFGVLTGKYHHNPDLLDEKSLPARWRLGRKIEESRSLVEAMDEIAADHDATTAQVALNWVIYSQGNIIVTIPGATKVEQAAQNAAAMDFRLSADEIARLDELSTQFL